MPTPTARLCDLVHGAVRDLRAAPVEERTAASIATYLRRPYPHVSAALRTLRACGLLRSRPIPTSHNGRPALAWSETR